MKNLILFFICTGFTLPAFAEAPNADSRLKTLEQKVQELERHQNNPEIRESSKKKVSADGFNPAVSLILDGKYATYSQNPSSYAIAGFAVDREVTERKEGFYADESEITLSANVDHLFYGQFTAAFNGSEVGVEEAFFETLSLGHGFTLRGGRFLSGIGYSNSVHVHAWDFADQALVVRALIGKHHYLDDGIQLRWVAPTDFFLEFGGELFRGDEYPTGGAERSGRGADTLFVRIGGDVGTSHGWRAGLSRLDARVSNRETGDETTPDSFTGDSWLSIADFVWKWAPNGNAREQNFKFQTEYYTRDEDGNFTDGASATTDVYQGNQKGWYAQGVYQFMPRWRLGLRYSEAKADAVSGTLVGTALDAQGHKPKATSLMLDFSNSEFSRLRLQVNRDEARVDVKDTQWFLQYTMSLGPHGAHGF
jgi:hypothetical protein